MNFFDRIRIFHALVITSALAFLLGNAAFAAEGLEVGTLSSRADMVSGGKALVKISWSDNTPLDRISATLNGQDVTKAFRPGRTPGSLVGSVEGLALGKNTLEIKVGSERRARLELINHPITGPIFSGPHQKPFICETKAAGLGLPLDADCSAKTVVDYIYKSTQSPPTEPTPKDTGPGAPPPGFKPFDRNGPRPSDLAQTTTTEGRTVNYIIRRETGTINRAIYEIAFLHDLRQPLPDPWTTTPGWNGVLVYVFGGGCGAGYRQGRSGLDYAYLSEGYALVSSSLNVFGNNCNDVLSAETLMMVKEYFIKQFGVPVHTIGWGGSGGSMQQHLIAQNYPGLLDGITPSVSFPDNTSFITSGVDCSLLDQAFNNSRQPWTEEQKTAVAGFGSWQGSCINMWIRITQYSPGLVRADACPGSIPKTLVYDPITNRNGVRCDRYDNAVNLYGRDRATGFARRPLDNVGVQYGLVAFNAGRISAEQFLELNESIGGYDVDGNIVPTRSVADSVALRVAYQNGRMNSGGGGLGAIPIIDFRKYSDPDIHDRYRSFAMRARLIAANGSADNQVILTVGPNASYAQLNVLVLHLMNQWLDNIDQDASHDSTARKVARNKPPELADACWTADGEKIAEPQTYDGPGRCNQLYPNHANPRIAAGGRYLEMYIEAGGSEGLCSATDGGSVDPPEGHFPSRCL